jgi:predicted ribosome quality control (RQC) complex YloA/Tae2 family protein
MKIIFMGTPQFAVPILEEIAKHHEVVLVVTQPDQYHFRRKEMVFSPVKEWAVANHYPVFQPEKIRIDYQEAIQNLEYEKTGNLLSAYLHQVKKGDMEITVDDFYLNGLPYTIKLDPLLSPTKNLENIFSKFKKAKRTIIHLKEQMERTKQDIEYYICLLEQLNLAKANDLREIYQELNLKKTVNNTKKDSKPNLTTYQDDDGNQILVGKNNIQNNYLTHKLAKKTDYFFHVQGSPGSQ